MVDRPDRDWNEEDRFWRDNYSSRSYARDRDYDEIRPAYRFGTESATRHRGRDWNDIEPDLRREWDSYEHRGSSRSTWEEIKQAAKDAWDRVTGDDDDTHRTTNRGMGENPRRV